jgi:AAA+ ATPase superfamily predicted ATPase
MNITILTGPQGSGKSMRAREMAKGKKALFVFGHAREKEIEVIPLESDGVVVVIDDFIGDLGKYLSSLSRMDSFSKQLNTGKMPDVIICVQDGVRIPNVSRMPNVNAIECNYKGSE